MIAFHTVWRNLDGQLRILLSAKIGIFTIHRSSLLAQIAFSKNSWLKNVLRFYRGRRHLKSLCLQLRKTFLSKCTCYHFRNDAILKTMKHLRQNIILVLPTVQSEIVQIFRLMLELKFSQRMLGWTSTRLTCLSQQIAHLMPQTKYLN